MKDIRTYKSDIEKEQVEEGNVNPQGKKNPHQNVYKMLSPREMQFVRPFKKKQHHEHILYFYNKNTMP